MGLARLTDKNYLAAIEGSVGTNMFRHLYVVDEDGNEFDATDDGDKSCALFVTSILTLFGRIDHPHATVAKALSIIDEMPDWAKTDNPVPGDLIVWGPNEVGNVHIGFVIDENEAISNSAAEKHPIRHGFKMTDGRGPSEFWHYYAE